MNDREIQLLSLGMAIGARLDRAPAEYRTRAQRILGMLEHSGVELNDVTTHAGLLDLTGTSEKTA